MENGPEAVRAAAQLDRIDPATLGLGAYAAAAISGESPMATCVQASLYSLRTGILAFVPNIWLAIAVRLFTGLGAGNVSTAQGYVADVTPPELRAGRMGLIGAAFGLGFIFGPAIGGLLTRPDLGPLGYQLPIFTASGLCVLAAIGVAVLLKESRVKADPAVARPPFLGHIYPFPPPPNRWWWLFC